MDERHALPTETLAVVPDEGGMQGMMSPLDQQALRMQDALRAFTSTLKQAAAMHANETGPAKKARVGKEAGSEALHALCDLPSPEGLPVAWPAGAGGELGLGSQVPFLPSLAQQMQALQQLQSATSFVVPRDAAATLPPEAACLPSPARQLETLSLEMEVSKGDKGFRVQMSLGVSMDGSGGAKVVNEEYRLQGLPDLSRSPFTALMEHCGYMAPACSLSGYLYVIKVNEQAVKRQNYKLFLKDRNIEAMSKSATATCMKGTSKAHVRCRPERQDSSARAPPLLPGSFVWAPLLAGHEVRCFCVSLEGDNVMLVRLDNREVRNVLVGNLPMDVVLVPGLVPEAVAIRAVAEKRLALAAQRVVAKSLAAAGGGDEHHNNNSCTAAVGSPVLSIAAHTADESMGEPSSQAADEEECDSLPSGPSSPAHLSHSKGCSPFYKLDVDIGTTKFRNAFKLDLSVMWIPNAKVQNEVFYCPGLDIPFPRSTLIGLLEVCGYTAPGGNLTDYIRVCKVDGRPDERRKSYRKFLRQEGISLSSLADTAEARNKVAQAFYIRNCSDCLAEQTGGAAEPPSACTPGSFVYAQLDATRQVMCFVVAVEGEVATLARLDQRGKEAKMTASVQDLVVKAAPVPAFIPSKEALEKMAVKSQARKDKSNPATGTLESQSMGFFSSLMCRKDSSDPCSLEDADEPCPNRDRAGSPYRGAATGAGAAPEPALFGYGGDYLEADVLLQEMRSVLRDLKGQENGAKERLQQQHKARTEELSRQLQEQQRAAESEASRVMLERLTEQLTEQLTERQTEQMQQKARRTAEAEAFRSKAEELQKNLRRSEETVAQLLAEHAARAQALEEERDHALGRVEMVECQRRTLEEMMSQKIAELGRKNAELLRMGMELKRLKGDTRD